MIYVEASFRNIWNLKRKQHRQYQWCCAVFLVCPLHDNASFAAGFFRSFSQFQLKGGQKVVLLVHRWSAIAVNAKNREMESNISTLLTFTMIPGIFGPEILSGKMSFTQYTPLSHGLLTTGWTWHRMILDFSFMASILPPGGQHSIFCVQVLL